MEKRPVPVLVGVAQYTQPKDAFPALDPLDMMVRVGRLAMEDSGAIGLNAEIDTVCVVNCYTRDDETNPAKLSQLLKITPKDTLYSLIGGNTPQMLVNEFARDIAAGKRRAVLLSGAEAVYALSRAAKNKVALDWPDNITWRTLKEKHLPANFDTLLKMGCDHEAEILGRMGKKYPEPNNDAEAAHDLFLPQFMYPFFETALRARAGRTPEAHQQYLGRLCARFSKIASENPHAWSRKPKSANEIAVATKENRYVVYPYTLRMIANINTDQAAAVVMMSERDAERLGIPASRRIYPLGGAEFSNIPHVSRRPCLYDSPAIREAARLALEQSGLALDEIDLFDLYSCFPSAVEIARMAVGIPEDDPRDLTVTGGLPYFGGPGNNYALHAIVGMTERIRRDPGLKGLITANGWYNSKHAVGVYGAKAPAHPWEYRDDAPIQRAIDTEALPEPMIRAQGRLTVEAYMIRYRPDGEPDRATVIGRMADGRRALADIDADARELRRFETVELVGRTGDVSHDPILGRNLLSFYPSARASGDFDGHTTFQKIINI